MLYSVLIFDNEGEVNALDEVAIEERLKKHRSLQKELNELGQLGPVAKLMPTQTALTLQGKQGKVLTTDGPYAETKEQLVGFYVLEAKSMEDALEKAKQLPLDGSISLEIRPIEWFHPGSL